MAEEEEKKEEKAEKRKDNWWSNLPKSIQFAALAGIFLIFYQAQVTEKPIQFQWLIFIGLGLWLLGKDKKMDDILDESVAVHLVNKKIDEKIKKRIITRDTVAYIGENTSPQTIDGKLIYFAVSITLIHPNGKKEYKVGKVDVKTRVVTIEDSIGKMTGRETIPIKTLFPKMAEHMKKYPQIFKGDNWRFLFK